MKDPIRISPDLALPLDVCTQALALLGMRGVGKTHTLTVLCEELIAARAPVAILDPLGVLWGLRASKDGKSEGLAVIVLGGEHGDVPLEPGSGRVIADWVVAERRPCVLDLSGFRKAEQRRFVTDFGVRLYEANREPLHLVVDEADLFAPQRPRPDETAMLGAFEDLVRRGRARGIGISLATQRPAVLHKDVLTQVGVLVALRVVGPQDRKAIEDWIEYHGSAAERKDVLASLGSLPIGTAWFWSPGWLGLLKRVKVRDRQTFDSSATPKLGAKRIEPQKLAPVDLDALRGRIAETIERAAADDPDLLRRRIAELEQEIERLAADAPEPERVEVPVLSEEAIARLERAAEGLEKNGIAAVEAARDLIAALPPHELLPGGRVGERRALPDVVVRRAIKPAPPNKLKPESEWPKPTGTGANLGKVERLILTVLAQQRGKSMTRERLALLVGYHQNAKGFTNGLGALRGRGCVEGLAITQQGLAELGPYEALPTGRRLLEWYCANKLSAPEAKILRAIATGDYSHQRDALAEAVAYHPNAKSFTNGLGRLRGLGLVEGLALSKELR
jgi:hypothetical protein